MLPLLGLGVSVLNYIMIIKLLNFFKCYSFCALVYIVHDELLLEMQTGLMDDGVKLTLLGSWMVLFVIFAGRKFTQPIKVSYYLDQILMFTHLLAD